jgi:pentatricopeptide repeat protein
MKSLNSSSSETDVLKTMDLISNMDEPMDEVLLSSVVEACVRIGKPDLVSSKLKQVQGSGSIAVNGSHTFGSLIKAYGFAKDMDGAWRCWKEMRSRHIRPTSVTLGCMVEAVVNNGDPEGAFELIHQISEDNSCRDVLNSVIYCSVLKGFARQKMVERAWAVYDEMCKRNVELSIVTYNTLIDACARSGRMDRMQNIMDDMTKFGIKPNLITYSTMLKGHCQAGDIQTAFKLLRQMKNESKFKPDEIMYNSLLDGCAQAGLVDEGLRLLEEMKTESVLPSNFTLSVLVKMMSRARRLDSAFEVVENITKEFNFRPNVHVYTNLAQACISNRSLSRAMGVLEKMLQQRIAPENRTYAILIRASLAQGLPEQAGGLLRGALGLRGAVPFLAASPLAECRQLDSGLVNETLVGIAEHNKDMGLELLADIRQEKPKVRIEVSTQRSLMMESMESHRGEESKQQQRTRPPHRGPAMRNGANACREPRGPISRRPH